MLREVWWRGVRWFSSLQNLSDYQISHVSAVLPFVTGLLATFAEAVLAGFNS